MNWLAIPHGYHATNYLSYLSRQLAARQLTDRQPLPSARRAASLVAASTQGPLLLAEASRGLLRLRGGNGRAPCEMPAKRENAYAASVARTRAQGTAQRAWTIGPHYHDVVYDYSALHFEHNKWLQ